MVANFTSVVLEDGSLPIMPSVHKRLGLNPGDQVRISIKVLAQPNKLRSSKARYAELLVEKDLRVLTPKEQAELIAFANAEFDAAIVHAKKLVQKNNPELFDEHGRLKKRQALASLRAAKRNKRMGTAQERKRQ